MTRLEEITLNTEALTPVEFEAAQTLAQLRWDQIGLEGRSPLAADQVHTMRFLNVVRQTVTIEAAMKQLGMHDPLVFAQRVRGEILPSESSIYHPEDADPEELNTFKDILRAQLEQARAVHGHQVPTKVMPHLRVPHTLQSALNFKDALSLGSLVTPQRRAFSPEGLSLVVRSVVAGFNETCQ